MAIFNSQKERRLWLYVFIILLAISMTLIFGGLLATIQIHKNLIVIIFWLSLILTGSVVIINGISSTTPKTDSVVWLGIIAVYLMMFIRLGMAERTHLIEYSVLATFFHKALTERLTKTYSLLFISLLAFVSTSIVGVVDEGVQMLLPDRVFDPMDILFNTLAAFIASLSIFILKYIKQKIEKK